MATRACSDPNSFRRGFTLVELAVVVAVLAILLAVAAPSFSDLMNGQRIRTTTSDLYSALILGRSEAMKRNITTTVEAASGDWQNGWTVRASGTTVLTQSAPVNVTVGGTVNGDPVTTISFAYTGRPLPASAGAVFTVSATGTSAQPRCITLNLSGMPQLKTDTDGDSSNGC